MHKIIKILSISTVLIILGAFFVMPVSAAEIEGNSYESSVVYLSQATDFTQNYNSVKSYPYYHIFWCGYKDPYQDRGLIYMVASNDPIKFKINEGNIGIVVSSGTRVSYTYLTWIPVGGTRWDYNRFTNHSFSSYSGSESGYGYYTVDSSTSQLFGGIDYQYFFYEGSPWVYKEGTGIQFYKNFTDTKPVPERELAGEVNYYLPGTVQPDGRFLPQLGEEDDFLERYGGYLEGFDEGAAFDSSFVSEPTEGLLQQISSFFKSNADDAEPIKITGTIFGANLNLTLLDPEWFNISNYAFLRLIFQLIISWHLLQFLVSLLFDILDIRKHGPFVYDPTEDVTDYVFEDFSVVEYDILD